ncbi:unnamed protein product [marine sediment metagenome]|uniref:Uncharacterized protein n=1 Tax=marine sediment metagenome TaxID=412755 RepID=X0UD45_9ZZZZ
MARTPGKSVTMRVRIGEREIEVSGPSDFVVKQVTEFVKQSKELGPTAEPRPSAAPAGGPRTGTPPTKKLSIGQFFKKTAPGTDVDRVLVAGYYLEHHTGMESFTAAETRDAIRDAKRTPPRNTNDSVNSNIKKGLIMAKGDKEGKIAFVLTSDGEETVAAMQNE